MKVANRPKFRKYIFASEANADTIEPLPDTQTEEQEAQGGIGYQKGFTDTNMKAFVDGGKAPRGQQLNQLFKDITSVTQYATMGGVYLVNSEVIVNTGYPKNAIVFNVTNNAFYRSLQDNNERRVINDKKYWQKIIDLNPPPPKPERQIGSFFYACRNETVLNGALLCNGAEYNLADYPDLEKYFINPSNQFIFLSFNEWDSYINNHKDNVGYFGYNPQSRKFRVPKIQSGTYLSSSAMPNGNLGSHRRGEYLEDRIVNIYGKTVFDTIEPQGRPGSSYQSLVINYTGETAYTYDENNTTIYKVNKTYNTKFRVSNTIRTGDRVMPRTIFENLYVTVSEHY